MTCHGGPAFFVSPNIESFGFVDGDDDIGGFFPALLPSSVLSRLPVLRCLPGVAGFFVFFFLVDFIIRVFFPCIPPFAMANIVLDRIVGMDEHRERTLNVNAHVLEWKLATRHMEMNMVMDTRDGCRRNIILLNN